MLSVGSGDFLGWLTEAIVGARREAWSRLVNLSVMSLAAFDVRLYSVLKSTLVRCLMGQWLCDEAGVAGGDDL